MRNREGDIETKKRRKISETIEIIEWSTDEDRKVFFDSHDIKVRGEMVNLHSRKDKESQFGIDWRTMNQSKGDETINSAF